uniref:Uncharacterized protein n=1 Tax=Oryza sativa subsp. japonica TaxID=39947 RepID=Q69TB8_ORYSJ|nr:hypothetical protein [Oryza sativa Japonica Group]
MKEYTVMPYLLKSYRHYMQQCRSSAATPPMGLGLFIIAVATIATRRIRLMPDSLKYETGGGR